MRSLVIVLTFTSLAFGAAEAKQRRASPPPRAFEEQIAKYARIHQVPESLIHRVIVRESRYNPRLIGHGRHYGLMQISYATARSMGYAGSPTGLLDPETNLSYAVPYLANAYRAAGGSEAGAVRLYASGYYYIAKRRGLLSQLRTANSPSLDRQTPPTTAPAAPPPESDNLFLRLFRSNPAVPPAQTASEAPTER